MMYCFQLKTILLIYTRLMARIHWAKTSLIMVKIGFARLLAIKLCYISIKISFLGGLREAFYGYNYYVKTNGMEKKLPGKEEESSIAFVKLIKSIFCF